MEPSLPGLAVCAALIALGFALRAPILVALFAALPFGSTAFATLTALGGSTPLVYTMMASLLVIATIARRSFAHELGVVFRSYAASWVVLGLLLYVVVGSQILPRLFAGKTTSFIIFRGGVLEQPLAPTSGNITQAGYFALGVLTFYCVSILLLRPNSLPALRKGFFVFVTASVAFGYLDLAAKLAGLGDVLLPIRTANYSFLTEISAGGFWRIVGAHPEASSFAIGALACLAFSLVYWRTTGSRPALVLAVSSFVLVALSTSTTAYVGLAVLGLVYAAIAAQRLLAGRIGRRDALVAAAAPLLLAVVLGISLADEKALEPAAKLIDTMVISKAQSASAQERAYWNERSLAALNDTFGLGVGLGSSRASSWLIAVISQLGIPGAILVGLLVVELLRPPGPVPRTAEGRETLALYRGSRAAALAYLVGGTLSGGAADPGILFFICLATALSSRGARRRPAATPLRDGAISPGGIHPAALGGAA